jgi:hypothetical protein
VDEGYSLLNEGAAFETAREEIASCDEAAGQGEDQADGSARTGGFLADGGEELSQRVLVGQGEDAVAGTLA